MENKKVEKSKNILVIIIVILTIIMLCGLGWYLYSSETLDALFNKVKDNSIPQSTENEDLQQTYVSEVHYTGGIGYPVVYSFAFDKETGNYVSNKELYSYNAEKKLNKIVTLSNDYIDAVFVRSYKNIQDNADEWKEKIKSYMHPYAYYDAYYLDEEQTYYGEMSIDDFLDELETYLISVEWEGECNYLTDTSLVYQDGYYYVRGILEYTNYSDYSYDISEEEKDSDEWIYAPLIDKGQTQSFCFEILISKDNESDGYKVVGFSPLFVSVDKNTIVKTYNTGLVPSMTSMLIEDFDI